MTEELDYEYQELGTADQHLSEVESYLRVLVLDAAEAYLTYVRDSD